MKKNALFFFFFSVVIAAVNISCSKTVKIPVSYTVVTNHDTLVENIFIPDTGIYSMPILVQFLSGWAQDSVTLKMTGLPSDISVSPATATGTPTFNQNFVFYTNHATHGTYNVTLTGTAPDEASQSYNFTVTVVYANCANLLIGNLNGTDSCIHAGKYAYTASAAGNGTNNTIIINNFGGYGPETYTTVDLNCDNDSLSIPYQNIGNGVSLSGSGTYSPGGMVITYSATGTPAGADNCTVTFTK